MRISDWSSDVCSSDLFPVRDSLPPPPAGTLAVVRLHQTPGPVVPGPTDDDRAFVTTSKLPLFVIGEWARPAPMWELAWLDGAVRSEEHTSELQSLMRISYAVSCLKKQTKQSIH